jgi:hypothetical protein
MTQSTDQWIHQNQMRWVAEDSLRELKKLNSQSPPQVQTPQVYVNPNEAFTWDLTPPESETQYVELFGSLAALVILILIINWIRSK